MWGSISISTILLWTLVRIVSANNDSNNNADKPQMVLNYNQFFEMGLRTGLGGGSYNEKLRREGVAEILSFLIEGLEDKSTVVSVLAQQEGFAEALELQQRLQVD